MATLVMVALDTYVWPSPPEPRLLESIAADLAITRKRLALVGQCYLDPFSAPLPSPLVKSRLAPGLALLNSVKERMKSPPQRLGALLQAIVTSEHVYLEVERLAAALLIRIAYRFKRSPAHSWQDPKRICRTACASVSLPWRKCIVPRWNTDLKS
jgi:hypothetical protein